MKFESKFNLNDRAWYMKDNKPVEVIIASIHIFHVGTDQNQMKYSARDIDGSSSWLAHKNLFESMVFKSKTELLESL